MASKDNKILSLMSMTLCSDGDQVLEIQDIWWLHWRLTNAAEMIGSVYNTQLLLWISFMSFDLLSRIYAMIDDDDAPFVMAISDICCIIASCVNLIFIIGNCHFTSRKVTEILRVQRLYIYISNFKILFINVKYLYRRTKLAKFCSHQHRHSERKDIKLRY